MLSHRRLRCYPPANETDANPLPTTPMLFFRQRHTAAIPDDAIPLPTTTLSPYQKDRCYPAANDTPLNAIPPPTLSPQSRQL